MQEALQVMCLLGRNLYFYPQKSPGILSIQSELECNLQLQPPYSLNEANRVAHRLRKAQVVD